MLARPLAVAAVALTLIVGCHSQKARQPLSPDQAKKLLVERNWIDRLPERREDKLHVFRFVPSMGGGVYQDRTVFAGTFELFQFRQDGRSIEFDLLHTGRHHKSRFTIEPIEARKRGDVDLKLTIDDSPRGPSVYYSWRQGGADLEAELARIAAE
jgi:hypothetical protein